MDLVVLTRVYVPARAARISCSVQRFVKVLGRADASDAKAASAAGMVLRSIVRGVGVLRFEAPCFDAI
jgi:hypothetical protein